MQRHAALVRSKGVYVMFGQIAPCARFVRVLARTVHLGQNHGAKDCVRSMPGAWAIKSPVGKPRPDDDHKPVNVCGCLAQNAKRKVWSSQLEPRKFSRAIAVVMQELGGSSVLDARRQLSMPTL